MRSSRSPFGVLPSDFILVHVPESKVRSHASLTVPSIDVTPGYRVLCQNRWRQIEFL